MANFFNKYVDVSYVEILSGCQKKIGMLTIKVLFPSRNTTKWQKISCKIMW